MYSSTFHLDEGAEESFESKLLRRARDEYNVELKTIEVQHTMSGDRKQTYYLTEKNHVDSSFDISHVTEKLYEIADFQSDSVSANYLS